MMENPLNGFTPKMAEEAGREVVPSPQTPKKESQSFERPPCPDKAGAACQEEFEEQEASAFSEPAPGQGELDGQEASAFSEPAPGQEELDGQEPSTAQTPPPNTAPAALRSVVAVYLLYLAFQLGGSVWAGEVSGGMAWLCGLACLLFAVGGGLVLRHDLPILVGRGK